jgi:CRP/FNR family transcriptional regulator, cyclic AMP receptor protein
MPRKAAARAFDLGRFLQSAGRSRRSVRYEPGQVIFSQGEPCTSVLYVQRGAVKLSLLSPAGKEAVLAIVGHRDFFGEGCLAGQRLRMATATAIAPSDILVVQKRAMIHLLHSERVFSDRFIAHMLARNIRIEEDLVDHLFNSSEKRLARTLLLLARYGRQETAPQALPKLSQEVLAEMIGTTRSRVNFFMNKFRKLGFIDYDADGVMVHPSLVSVVLHE